MDRNESRVSGETVHVRDEDDNVLDTDVTDGSGNYSITFTPPAGKQVKVWWDGIESALFDILHETENSPQVGAESNFRHSAGGIVRAAG